MPDYFWFNQQCRTSEAKIKITFVCPNATYPEKELPTDIFLLVKIHKYIYFFGGKFSLLRMYWFHFLFIFNINMLGEYPRITLILYRIEINKYMTLYMYMYVHFFKVRIPSILNSLRASEL